MKNIRPWSLLPQPHPKDFDPSVENPNYFYENFCKPIVEDMVKMTAVGLCVDQEAVEGLRHTIDTVLESVAERLSVNPLVIQYQEHMHPALVAAHKATYLVSVREPEYYLKEYVAKNMTHRTWAVNDFLCCTDRHDKLKDKWTVADVKKLNIFIKSRFLDMVIDGSVSTGNMYVVGGMQSLAEEQSRLWNLPRINKSNEEVVVPAFNPGSAKQLQEFFKMLGIPAISTSGKTGEASWNRKNIEMLHKSVTSEHLLLFLQCVIDHSFSGIIRSNFLAAFDSFTIDGMLYGNIRVFGAKSLNNCWTGIEVIDL